ncbi:MAG: carbonic anhydrase [Cyanosarcina radialis HA8281-LM2]|nr:carbonic anhydrase [Cyanosarcina radialis HA8281-LM2]
MERMENSIDRRHFLQLAGVSLTAAATGSGAWLTQTAPARAEEIAQSLDPEQALKRLLDGNQRFLQQQLKNPDRSKERLKELAQVQHPFATILSCADSRVAPEILFDEGMGDLFDVRVAGNVVTPEVLGSLEYAVAVLNTPLVMILGHERCGAVTAAIKNERISNNVSALVKAIAPAISKVKDKDGDVIEQAVVANVHYQIEQLKQNSVILSERSLEGKLKVIGGRYDLDTGEVTLV